MMRLTSWRGRIAFIAGVVVSAVWAWLFIAYVGREFGWANVDGLALPDQARLVTGGFAPLIFIWLFLNFIARDNEIRTEAKLLREEIRRLTYPDADAEARIEAVTGSLRRQTEELTAASDAAVNALGGIDSAFDKQQVNLKNAAENLTGGTQNFETTIQAALAEVRQGAEALQKQRAALTDDASKLRTVIQAAATDATQRIAREQAAHTKSVEDVVSRIASEEARLVDLLREQEQRIASLVSHLLARHAEQAKEMGAATDRLVDQADEAGQRLVGVLDTRMTGFGSAAEQVGRRLLEMLKGSTDGIEATIGKLEAQERSLEKTTARHGDALRQAVADMQAANAELEDAVSARNAAMATATEAFDERVRTLGNSLDKLSTRTDETAKQAGERFEVQIATIASGLDSLSTRSDDAAKQAGEWFKAQIESVAGELDALSARATEAADGSAERFETRVRDMESRIDALTARTDEAATESTGRLETQIRTIGDSLDTLALRASDAAAEALDLYVAKITAANDDAIARGKALTEEMQETGAGIARLVSEGLDGYLARIREANASAGEDADKFVDRLSALAAKAGELAAHHLDDYIGRIAAASRVAASDSEQLQQALLGQVTSIEAALQRAAGIGDGTRASVESLRAEADALAETWAQASERAASLGRTLKDEAQLAETTGEAAAGALRTAFAEVNQRLEAVEAAAVAVATRIENATGAHTTEIAKLAETADAGRDRIRAAGVALADQASKLTLVAFGATRAQQQVGAAIRSLAQQVDEMAASGEGRMTDLAGMLARTRDEISASAASAVQQSETISQTFRNDAEKLVEIAQNAGVQAAAVKGVVREHLEELTQLSNQVAQLVQLVRSGLKGQAEQFKAVAAGARADTNAIREELTQQARTLTEAADQVAGLLNQVGDAVDSKAERLITAADHAMQRSSDIAGLFDAQARVLTGAVDGAAEKVDELGRRFEARRMALNEAAAAAEAQMAALDTVRKDATRDSFLRSAKAMMDELNAIALDMNALFESEVPEDIWRGYNKGDRSIFARRLFKTRDSYLVPAIEQRYEGDPRFRELVTRYVSTFEDLLTKANEIEPEGTLNATFITADVGKLYLVLSRSLGQASH